MERKRGRRRGDRVGWEVEGGNAGGGGEKRETESDIERKREKE